MLNHAGMTRFIQQINLTTTELENDSSFFLNSQKTNIFDFDYDTKFVDAGYGV